MQPPLSQSKSSLKVNNYGNQATTKHFWIIKSLSKFFPFAELSVLEVALSLRIPRRWVLSTCTFDGQLPFETTTWLWGSCTGRERSTRAQPRWRRNRGTKDLCEDAQGLLPCTRSQKLLRHACCRPGFSLRPVEWKRRIKCCLPFQIHLHDDPGKRGECRQSVERTKDSWVRKSWIITFLRVVLNWVLWKE